MSEDWLDVGELADVTRRKKVVVESGEQQILVLAHDDELYAFDNICIHRQRELARGVVLNGRLICPGHQWAFDLASGWESIKEECQPTYCVRVDNGTVQVDVASRRVVGAPTAADR